MVLHDLIFVIENMLMIIKLTKSLM